MKHSTSACVHAFLAFMLVSCVADAAPRVNGVSGLVEDGANVTLNGTSFGNNGPNVILFDNYGRGTDGQAVTTSANIGTWNANGCAQYVADDVGSNMAATIFVPTSSCDQTFVLPDLTNTIYVSYKLKVPDGYRWPTSGAEERFPTFEENWHWGKFMKMYDYETGFSATDDDWQWGYQFASLNGWTGRSADRVITFNGPYHGVDDPWSWDNWTRFDAFVGGGSSPRASDGHFLLRLMSEEWGQWNGGGSNLQIFDGQDRYFDPPGEWRDNNIPQWTFIHFNGQFSFREIPWDNAWAVWIDDIYIATGPGARARVEIGNNINYANCTKLDISTPTSWSNTSVDVTIRLSQFAINEDAYLFVVDENGIAGPGYAVTVGRNTRVLPKTTLSLKPGIRVAETCGVLGRRVSKFRKANCAHLILLQRHGQSTKRTILIQP